MRIALCLEYPIALRGGVSVLVETLVRELVLRGHEIVLVSNDTPASLRECAISDLIQRHFFWPARKPTRMQARQLAQQLKSAGVEVAHFQVGGVFGFGNRIPFCSPAYFADRQGIPCVNTSHSVVHWLDGFCGPKKPLWFKLLLLPVAWLGKLHQMQHVRTEIAVSNHDYEKLRRWYAPLRSRLQLIYHSRLDGAELAIPEVARENVILNVGHVARRKGQAVLAEAFAEIGGRHPTWRLEFAGKDLDGITVERIQQLQAQPPSGQRILLLGERTDATALMRRSAIYAQPSLEEALGLALQEAMACGCAVVGSRVGGIPELIKTKDVGLLVEPASVPELAGALEVLMDDAAKRQQLGQAAARFIRTSGMTAESMVSRHLEIYESICVRDGARNGRGVS
jgi:glycosyltransferase involved in cell wall biosynthesis